MILVTEAQAQATEATAAAAKAGDWYLTQGVLGVTSLLFIGISIFLFWKLDRLSTSIMREAITALTANTAATTAGTLQTTALKGALEATDDGVEKLSRQTELAAQAAQSRGDEILSKQRDILARMDAVQGQLGKLEGIERDVGRLLGART